MAGFASRQATVFSSMDRLTPLVLSSVGELQAILFVHVYRPVNPDFKDRGK